VAKNEPYLLDNQQVQAGQRFDALGALFNASTFRHARHVGLARGWRFWEVGAGSASVPAWLAEQVGPDGHVLATDIDTSWIDENDANFEVRRHDVGGEPPPEGPFDLIHARLVLVHVPERDHALASLVGALRPGGWLLLEEADPQLQPLVCIDESGPEQELANRLKRGFRVLMAERGVDLAYGRTLPRRMRDHGLVNVESDAYFPTGGPRCADLERATVEQIGDHLVDAGLATREEIEAHLGHVESGRLDLATSPMISAWGQKPSGEDAAPHPTTVTTTPSTGRRETVRPVT